MRSLCGGRAHYLLTLNCESQQQSSGGGRSVLNVSVNEHVVVTQFGESFLESTHKKIAKILLLFRKMSRA